MTRALILGDSHVATLKHGLDQLEPSETEGIAMEIVGISGAHLIEPFFQVESGVARVTLPSLAGRVPRLPTDPPMDAYVWSGLFHFAKIWRDPTWRRFRPWQVPGPEVPVSEQVIAEKISGWFRQQLGAVEFLHRSGAPTWVVETPRPFRHHPCLQSSRAEVVAGVDGICHRLMRAHLRRLGIPVVRIPAQCVDAEGFMLPQWRHDKPEDPHHGGAAFGVAMVRRIRDTLRGQHDGE